MYKFYIIICCSSSFFFLPTDLNFAKKEEARRKTAFITDHLLGDTRRSLVRGIS